MASNLPVGEKLPVTVLTGYLGSGKTTLLNNLITNDLDGQTAVIVNEFGAISIDAQLVVGVDEDVIEINNGCICCTVRADLVSTITNLLSGPRAIRRILIETTGLADPAPVIQSFMLDETLRAATQLDAVVTVVDALNVAHWLADARGGENVAREQIAFADVVVITKGDLVTLDGMAACEDAVRAINPLARVTTALHGAADASAILDVAAFDLRNALAIEPLLLSDIAHEHDDDVVSVEVRLDRPLDGDRFFRWLNLFVQARKAAIFRIKGVLDLEGEARRYVFHGVHMTLDGRPGRPWEQGTPRTSAIVFIGRGLSRDEIRTGVGACVSATGLAA
jgi:G3E family GTPase